MAGDKELDRALKAIADIDGPKSINTEMRKSTREAAKDIVMPQVQSNVPIETGLLAGNLVVKSIKRSRSKMGTALGFRDDLFKGPTFYGAFLEYGFRLKGGGYVPGDSFLRRPLYGSASAIKSRVIGRLRRWIAARNR